MDELTKKKLIGRFKNEHTANVKHELVAYGEMEDCVSMLIYSPAKQKIREETMFMDELHEDMDDGDFHMTAKLGEWGESVKAEGCIVLSIAYAIVTEIENEQDPNQKGEDTLVIVYYERDTEKDIFYYSMTATGVAIAHGGYLIDRIALKRRTPNGISFDDEFSAYLKQERLLY